MNRKIQTMRNFIVAFALTTLPVAAVANDPDIFLATSAEKASGHNTLAECEEALRGTDDPQGEALVDNENGPRGSRFNRNAGNTSRCETVEGEPLIVVYPKGHEKKDQ